MHEPSRVLHRLFFPIRRAERHASHHRSRNWRVRCRSAEVDHPMPCASALIRSRLKYSMLSPLYMAEISPPEVRGSLMALEQFSIVLGAVVGFWTGFFTRNGELLSEAHVCLRDIHYKQSTWISFVAHSTRDSAWPRYLARSRLIIPACVPSIAGSSRKTRRSSAVFGKTETAGCRGARLRPFAPGTYIPRPCCAELNAFRSNCWRCALRSL